MVFPWPLYAGRHPRHHFASRSEQPFGALLSIALRISSRRRALGLKSKAPKAEQQFPYTVSGLSKSRRCLRYWLRDDTKI
jgi:hypothetical protein